MSEIDAAHRLRTKTGDSPVIVRFVRRSVKEAVSRAARTTRPTLAALGVSVQTGAGKIYMNGDLTRSTAAVY